MHMHEYDAPAPVPTVHFPSFWHGLDWHGSSGSGSGSGTCGSGSGPGPALSSQVYPFSHLAFCMSDVPSTIVKRAQSRHVKLPGHGFWEGSSRWQSFSEDSQFVPKYWG